MNGYDLAAHGPLPVSRTTEQTTPPAWAPSRPEPVVKRHRPPSRVPRSMKPLAITISQRDETVLIDARQARRLAHALLRAARV